MKPLFLIISLLLVTSLSVFSQALDWDQNRIAVSADGNNQPDDKHKWTKGDPDDWGGTPAALAILAKLKLQDKLVHYSYNNFIEAPAHTTATNHMKIGADGGIKYWNFDASRFFDVSAGEQVAVDHLAAELAKSTAEDPLYFIHMGPAEFFYRCVKKVVDSGDEAALAHVYVISHSGYNDNHLRRGDPKFDIEPVAAEDKHHTMKETLALSGNRLMYKKIKDQNSGNDPNAGWKSHEDWSVWYWMRDHQDPSVQWIYERMLVNAKNSADVSDAGMLYYLLLNDENGSPSKFKTFIGEGINDVIVVNPPACEDFTWVGIKDFEMEKISTFVPPYKDKGRNAVAINAGVYKGKFAAAQKEFTGVSGFYNITLTSLTEEDGESTYRIKVNGELVAEVQNPETDADMAEHKFDFEKVYIPTGAIVQIESNTHSNGKIPEGDAFAYSRGRWRSIAFQCTEGQCDVQDVDGLIVFEAERMELKGAWKLGNDDKASGGEYIYFDGGNNYSAVDMNHVISYTFNVKEAGNYTVKWLMRQPEGERGTDKGNDVWIYFSDDIAYASKKQLTHYEKFYSRSGDDFILHGVAEVHGVGHSWLTAKFPTAGKYTINIGGRSHGLQIDRIVMFKGMSIDDVELKLKGLM